MRLVRLHSRGSVARNCIFSLIWRCKGPKRYILDYWGTIIFLNPIIYYQRIKVYRVETINENFAIEVKIQRQQYSESMLDLCVFAKNHSNKRTLASKKSQEKKDQKNRNGKILRTFGPYSIRDPFYVHAFLVVYMYKIFTLHTLLNEVITVEKLMKNSP